MDSDNSAMKVKQPISLQWNIPENKLQELRNSIDGSLTSTVFYIVGSGIKYSLRIFPNGDIEDRRGKTNIFLCLDFEGKKEIKSEFSISIASANFTYKMERVFSRSTGWGCTSFTVENLFDPKKRFIVDGEMVVKLDGILNIEMDAPVKLLKLGSTGNKLCINLWNQDIKDFTIIAEEKDIQSHKLILSSRSPVFAAMFQPHTKEAQEGRVTIPDFSFDVVEAAVRYCYDSSLVPEISLEDKMSLLQFFDKYDIEDLKEDLEKHLISQIRDSNVCRLANCAILSNAPELLKKCSDHLQKCVRDQKKISDSNILDKNFVHDLFSNLLSI